MFEHVNRVRLVHTAVFEGQVSELADHKVDARTRFSREEGSCIHTDEMRA